MTMNQVSITPNQSTVIADTIGRTRRLLAAIGCIAFAACGPLGTPLGTAQEIPLVQLPPAAAEHRAVDEVRRKLDQLIETTEQARRLRGGQAFPSPMPSGEPAAPQWTPPVESAPQASSEDPDTVEKINEIRERLRILQRFRRDEAISQRAGAVAPEVPEPKPPATAEVRSAADANTKLDQQVAPALAADRDAATESDADDAAKSVPDESVSGQRLLPDAVDSFALGESLFRTGNYRSALQALQAADTSGMSPSEHTWLDLMIALCQRKIGTYDKAEGGLREIANAKSSDYPVRIAKWWLKYAEADYESKTRLEALETEIELLLERSRSHVQSP